MKVLACPLLILHAEDDAVLPLHLGRKVGTTISSAWALTGMGAGLACFQGAEGEREGVTGPRVLERGLGSPVHAANSAPTPRQLFETARSAYKDKTKVKFITFPEKLGLGHDYISFNPELPTLVK